MDIWRLIINSPNSGAWNMALDEAILENVATKRQPPTMRLYDWHPYALSLGHAQPFADVNLETLNSQGWDVVRRPTGGRAILHADELTYSISAHEDDSHVSGNVLESYRLLSSGLLKGLEIAGIVADSKPKNQQEKNLAFNPVCFQYPSDYEITFQGKKLIGSAQARRNHGVLQHGAIPLFGDITRIVAVLSFPDEQTQIDARQLLAKRATNIEQVLNKNLSWFFLAECMQKGFEQALGIQFVLGNASAEEKQRAHQLLHEKYANPEWTQRI